MGIYLNGERLSLKGSSISVLHIDDEKAFLELTRFYLQKLNEANSIKYYSFTDPQLALNDLIQNPTKYDVIISDYQMPILTGLEFLKIIRDTKINIPFIILTGKGREEVVVKALNLGANRYIRKGFDSVSLYKELLHTIKSLHAYFTSEKKIKEREELYHHLIETSPDAILNVDLQGEIFFINKQGLALFGYKNPEDIYGTNIFDFMIDEEKEIAAKNIHTIIEEHKSIIAERTFKHKDGSYLFCSVHVTKIHHPILGDECLMAIIRDLTEKKRMGEQLKEEISHSEKQEAFYQSIFENTGTATVIIEADRTISLANTKFEQLSGYKKNEIEYKKKWSDFVVQEDLERMLKFHKERRKGREEIPTEYEFVFVDRFGNKKNIYLRVDVIPGTMKSVASLADITNVKQLEQELLYYIHLTNHEFKNNLSKIRGYLSLYEEEKNELYLRRIEANINYLEEMMIGSEVITKSNDISLEKSEVNLNGVIHNIAFMMIDKTIELKGDVLPTVIANSIKTYQIFKNLIENAVKHGDPSSIQIKCERKEGSTIISVINDGTLLNRDLVQKVFTKQESFMGISDKKGLHIVKKHVRAQGWCIKLDERTDKVSFSIIIPQSDVIERNT